MPTLNNTIRQGHPTVITVLGLRMMTCALADIAAAIVGFIVQLQFYFQTSSNSNLSKLRLMSLPRLRQ